jgi:hypothetical protein
MENLKAEAFDLVVAIQTRQRELAGLQEQLAKITQQLYGKEEGKSKVDKKG